MSLSINPFAKLVASASEAVNKATAEAQAFKVGNAIDKAQLDANIDRLSGGLSSGLNGLTAGAGSALGGITSQFGDLTKTVQSNVTSGISSLQSVAGSTSNISADITGSLTKVGGSLAGGIKAAAGGLSKAAGMVNDLLSGKRGANLPAGGEVFTQQGSPIELSPGSANDWRVRLQTNWKLFDSEMFKLLEDTGGVVWPYMPNITVATKANYTTVDVTHSNYPFYSYKNSAVEDITITGDFTCETSKDAAYWIAATTFFKTATKMFFGQSSRAGNPPIICNLTGYGASIFDNVPVIVKDFSVDLKDDVNYIRCDVFGTSTWVPVVSTITVKVAPIYNRARLRSFSLDNYSRGKTQSNDGIGFI